MRKVHVPFDLCLHAFACGARCSANTRKGGCHDNACADSSVSTLKNALIHHCDFPTGEQARSAIFGYIGLFYNRPRRHASLGC
jgi:transposase InsO family protein